MTGEHNAITLWCFFNNTHFYMLLFFFLDYKITSFWSNCFCVLLQKFFYAFNRNGGTVDEFIAALDKSKILQENVIMSPCSCSQHTNWPLIYFQTKKCELNSLRVASVLWQMAGLRGHFRVIGNWLCFFANLTLHKESILLENLQFSYELKRQYQLKGFLKMSKDLWKSTGLQIWMGQRLN